MDPEKFYSKIETLAVLNHDLQKLLLEPDRVQWGQLKEGFLNCHTMKGIARAFGLRRLCDTLHQAEDEIQITLGKNAPVISANLQESLLQVSLVFAEYRRLGARLHNQRRTDGLTSVSINRVWKIIQARDNTSLAADSRENSRWSELRSLCLLPLAEVLHDAIGDLSEVAQALGKPTPTVQISAASVVVDPDMSRVIQKSFVHLVRNSIDHGIESPEIREKAGKLPAGRVEVSCRAYQDRIELVYQDDGRGLDVEKIRTRALQENLLRQGQELDLETLVQSIFVDGFSTSSEVSEISGRGVGMSAVKGYIESLGGEVKLVLDPSPIGSEERFVKFRTVFTLYQKLGLRNIS